MARATLSPEEILGQLDEVSRKYAPDRLYIEGDDRLLRATVRVSIVGSRSASDLAIRRAIRLTTELLEKNVVIVSGLAKGVDHAAHSVAMQIGGRTIAVIATPLDRVYPKEHAELQAEIARSHLVVTQSGPEDKVGRWSFPARNRTMALLTHATVIVEAGESSGTLHQGWEAIRLGRPLFFMQSILEDTTLEWPRKMMDYGARPLASAADLLSELPSAELIAYGLADF
jgi:DNA processing protein